MPLRALNEFLPRPSATCGGLNRGIRAGQRGRSDGSAGRERKRPGAQPRGWGDGRRRRTAALAIARSRSNRGGPSTTSWTFRGPRRSVRKSPIAGRGVLEAATTITGRRADQRIRASDHLGGGRSGRGDIVPAGSPRVRNEGARGEVHSRRWRTGSTSRRRARAPCTPGRSWPNGSSPARTRRSPSSRSGVTRGFVRCVRRCASAGGPGRGPGRGSRDSFVRSVAVRPNAEGGGLARRPGARVRDWVGDGADVWRYQFGSQCVGQRADEGGRLRGSEPFLANHELKNFRVRRHTYIPTEIRLHFFRGGTNVPTHLDGSPWRRVDFSEQPRPATSTLSMR